MAKTVLGHAAYQLIVIFTLLNVETLVPKMNNGTFVEKFGLHHLTVLFNSFVFMQIFNEINSRKINDEHNVFDRILTNKIFMGVIIGTIITQVKTYYIFSYKLLQVNINDIYAVTDINLFILGLVS